MNYATKEMLWGAIRDLSSTVYNLVFASKVVTMESQVTLLRNLVLSMPEADRCEFADEWKFVRGTPLSEVRDLLFPYPRKEGLQEEVSIRVEREGGLPYVVHKPNVRVFFPKCMGDAEVKECYRQLKYLEGITGEGSLVVSPHCYQDDEFRMQEGDVLLDVGCAEALFSLENAEKARQIYLFECDRKWIKPLKQSFKPYKDKTVIVEKAVSDRTTSRTIRIADAVTNEGPFFVKMDIEGAERLVLKASEGFLKGNKVKLSCCVYHRQDDAEVIRALLEGYGYTTRFSKGYMLPTLNGTHYPYFRKGVIYAWN